MQTLDDMIKETASYCDVDISKTNGAYTGDSLVVVDKLISAINYAIKKIALEKVNLEYSELLVEDTPLTKTFYKALSLKNSDNEEVDFSIESGQVVYDYDDPVTLRYAYIPTELSGLTDIPELPPSVDLRIPCYYSAYLYLVNDSDERAGVYLDLWNDGFNSLVKPKRVQKRIMYKGW